MRMQDSVTNSKLPGLYSAHPRRESEDMELTTFCHYADQVALFSDITVIIKRKRLGGEEQMEIIGLGPV